MQLFMDHEQMKAIHVVLEHQDTPWVHKTGMKTFHRNTKMGVSLHHTLNHSKYLASFGPAESFPVV